MEILSKLHTMIPYDFLVERDKLAEYLETAKEYFNESNKESTVRKAFLAISAIVTVKTTYSLLKMTIFNPIPAHDYPKSRDENAKVMRKAMQNGTLPKVYRANIFPGSTLSNTFVITDFDLMKEAFSRREMSHRENGENVKKEYQNIVKRIKIDRIAASILGEDDKIFKNGPGFFMGFASGPFDDFHRSGRTDWHSTLKKLVGKNRVAEVVKENSQKLVQRLLEKGNTKEGIDPKIILINTVLTTTTSFSFGKNYEDDDPEFLQVRDWIDEYIDGFLYLALKYTTLDLFPSWFGQSDFYFNLWAKSPLQKLYKAMPHFMTYIFEQVKEARKGLDKENPRHFLDMLIIRADEEPRWGYFQLAATIINIYAATGDTLSNTVLWLLMTLADNPEIQEKMHEEIKEARMKDPNLNPADIPYTRSVLLENQRRNPITDSLAHMVSEETVVQGVVFPKNSTVIGSLTSIMLNPKYFPEPEKFIPDRFLKNGKYRPDQKVCPFGVGLRDCIGKSLALEKYIGFATEIVENIKITRIAGDHSLAAHDILHIPKSDIRLRFQPR